MKRTNTACFRGGWIGAWLFLTLCAGNVSSADQGEPKTLAVVGKISDASGDPVPDATVSLVLRKSVQDIHVESQTTDSEGNYRFELSELPRSDIGVVAWKKGYAVGTAKRSDPVFDPGKRLRLGSTADLPITLAAPTPLKLKVVDEKGQPFSKGRVGVAAISFPGGTTSISSYDLRLDYLTRQLDKNGHVTLDYLSEGYGAGVLLETNTHGSQRFSVGRERVADGATVKLLAPGTVNLALSSDDSHVVSNRKLHLQSRPTTERAASDEPATLVTPGWSVAVVRTDAEGRATTAIAHGAVSVALGEQAEDKTFLERPAQPTPLEPNNKADIQLKLVKGVRAFGKVLAEEDKPVEGVELSVYTSFARTDAKGRFEAWVPRTRRVFIRVYDVPRGFVWPYDAYTNATNPPEGSEEGAEMLPELEIPTIRVKRASPVSGKVVDQNGKPVAQVDVTASWVQTHDVHSYFTLKSDAAQSDAQGRFELHHVLPDVDVRLTARSREVAMRTATMINTDGPQETTLEVTPDGMVSVSGQVVGSDGPALANAEIKVSRAMLAPNGNTYGNRVVELGGKQTIQTDQQGQFLSPVELPRYGKYSITISAPGYLAVETEHANPPETGSTFEIGKTVLTRARTVGGFIRDSNGKPIGDATVWSHRAPQSGRSGRTERSESKTDAMGRFTLEQLHPLAAFAIVEKEGYRTTGCPLMIDQGGVSITMYRDDEVIPPEKTIRPTELDKQKRQDAARQLLGGIMPLRRNSSYFHDKAIAMLTRFDAEAALAEVSESNSSSTRAKALARLGETDDAMAESETIDSGYSRAFARFAVVDQIRDPSEAKEILATILLDAKSIRRPDRRALIVANIADRFIKLDDRDRAEKILRDELPQAQALSTKEWAGFARASFAERLSHFDLDSALKMVSEAEEDDRTRHFQNIAHSLAAVNPDGAEAALDKIDEHLYVDAPVVRTAYRMATVDPERAARLLDRIDEQQRPTSKARGLGVIAYALRESNPEQARDFLAQAFAAIPEQYGGGGSRVDDIIGTSITLLRFAEEVDPDRLTDYFWQALSSYPGPDGGAWRPENAAEEDADRQAQLALFLAQYDGMPGLAAQVMDPVFEYWEQQIGKDPNSFDDREATFIAMALTDPERAGDWAHRFDQELNKQLQRRIPQPWEVIGNTLTQDRTTIGKAITREVFHRWVVDEYDF